MIVRSIGVSSNGSVSVSVHSAGMEATNGTIEHDFHNTLVPINGSHSGSSGRSTPNGGDPAPGKLFVGGLSWQTSSEKLREYFGMFGTVTDVLIMKDPVTQVGLYHLSIILGLLDQSRLLLIHRTGLFARHSSRRLQFPFPFARFEFPRHVSVSRKSLQFVRYAFNPRSSARALPEDALLFPGVPPALTWRSDD